MMRAFLVAAAAAIMLSGCGAPAKNLVETNMAGNSRDAFMFCSGFGCSRRHNMSLSDAEWEQIRGYFLETAPDAASERAQIAEAIGHIERIMGEKAGTKADRPGASIIPLHSTRGQQDCIDEAYNTTTYLQFMEADNFLKWHKVGLPAHRGMVLDRWFHNTATVIENETGTSYVIDSWFGANGEASDVTTLEAWDDGWSPPLFSTRKDK